MNKNTLSNKHDSKTNKLYMHMHTHTVSVRIFF